MNKNEKFVITVNRELGSGGRTVGRKLAERLQVKYYDKALIQGLTKEFGLTVEEIERIKGQKKSWWTEFNNYYMHRNATALPMEAETVLTTASMIGTEQRILQDLAAEESCVVAGRSGFLVFREWPNHVNVFIQAPMECRIQRVMTKQGAEPRGGCRRHREGGQGARDLHQEIRRDEPRIAFVAAEHLPLRHAQLRPRHQHGRADRGRRRGGDYELHRLHKQIGYARRGKD